MSNLSLNVAALIRDPDSGQQQFARVKVPQKTCRALCSSPRTSASDDPEPRVHRRAPGAGGGLQPAAAVPRHGGGGHYFFRVTRDADLELRDLEADDLMEALQQGLRKRRMGGEVVRLEVADEMPDAVVDLLMEGMRRGREDLDRIQWPPRPRRPDEPAERSPLPNAEGQAPPAAAPPPPWRGRQKSLLEDGSIKAEEFESIFSVLRRGDVLLHHPFDLFSTSVEEFINQAADDPSVLAIKMTLYRVSKDSPIIAALIRAAENGKQVMALVELKARFDEDNNIQWARQLERSGVHVVYGVIGLKTHTKITLVVRKEKEICAATATSAPATTTRAPPSSTPTSACSAAAPNWCRTWWSCSTTSPASPSSSSFRKLLVAPVTLRQRMEELIQRETEHARAGRPAAIKAKMNALVDPAIIALLYEASQAGVQIDLVVRGMCSLRPGLEGVSDNIRVVQRDRPLPGALPPVLVCQWRRAPRSTSAAPIGWAATWIAAWKRWCRSTDPTCKSACCGCSTVYLSDNSTAWDMHTRRQLPSLAHSRCDGQLSPLQVALIDALDDIGSDATATKRRRNRQLTNS
jgi:polyphosphate kinase